MDGIWIFLIVYAAFIVVAGWVREKRGGSFMLGALLGIFLGPLLGALVAGLAPPLQFEQEQRARSSAG